MYEKTENQRLKNVTRYLIFKGRAASVADLADKIGQNRSGVSEKINGRKPITKAFVLRLTEAFPEINPDYLLRVDCDEMLLQNQHSVVEGYRSLLSDQGANDSSPMLEEPVVAYGNYEKHVAELQGYISQLNEHIKRLTAIIDKLTGGQA